MGNVGINKPRVNAIRKLGTYTGSKSAKMRRLMGRADGQAALHGGRR